MVSLNNKFICLFRKGITANISIPAFNSLRNTRYSIKTLKYADFIFNKRNIVYFVVSLFVATPVAAVEPYVLASAGNYTSSVTTQWGQLFQTYDTKRLLDKAELLAGQTVMLEADPDFFESFSPDLLLSLARRIDVLDPSSRHLVLKEAITLLENDVSRVQDSESSSLNANLMELQSTLRYARQQYTVASDSQLQAFSDEVSRTADDNKLISSNRELTLDDAAKLLEKRGINPYDKEARPYYCELGFTGLDTLGVHYVSFCSKLAAR